MAFTPFDYDMDIIAKLSDSPNVDDGLTAAQLKGKFDEAGKVIKNYINGTLLVEALEKPDFQGMVKSNGTGFIAAEAGKDYQAPIGTGDITKEMLAETYAAPSKAVTVPIAGWAEKTVTVNVAGVTADNHVIVTPHPDSFMAWADSMVRCTAQGAGTLTFRCEDVPGAEIKANVLIVG